MLLSAVTGRPVVSTSSAQTIGKLVGLVVDPTSRSVVALELADTMGGSVVGWRDLTAVGTDAVTVPSADVIVDPSDDLEALLDKHNRLQSKRVLAASGDELGEVVDVEFDPESGAIVTLILNGAVVPGVRLIGVGSYAVVVATA